jgi:hypothetical protein
MRYIEILEAGAASGGFESKKKALGEVPFITSSQADAHIKKMVKMSCGIKF